MKKGERASHRVRFEWESGIKGTIPCMSLDHAELKAAEIRRNSEMREIPVVVTIEATGT